MEEQKAPSGEAMKPAPKSRALWIVVAVLVVVVVVLLAAALGGLFAPGAPPAKDKELRLGSILSITGSLAFFGADNERGVRMAVSEINAAGGVLGNPIIVFLEDGPTATAARTAAEKVVTTNHVDAIVGASGSSICLQVLEVAKANDVFEVSASCTSVVFSNQSFTGGWFARTAPPDSLQAAVAADYVKNVRLFSSVAVIGNDNAYGRGLANLFEQRFEAKGGTITLNRIVKETAPPQSATTYVPDLQAVFATNPQAIYVVLYPNDGILMMREIWGSNNPQWINTPIIFSEGVFDTQFINALVVAEGIDPAVVERIQGTAPGEYFGVYGAQYAPWHANWTTRWGKADHGLFTPGAYDAVYLIALAAQVAGEATGQAIKSNIRKVAIADTGDTIVKPGGWAAAVQAIAAGKGINYQGAVGGVELDTKNEPLGGYGIWDVNDTAACGGPDTTNCTSIVKIYEEAEVVALLGAPPFLVELKTFVVDWKVATRD